ncbi:hypothetical protein [Stenotrophomonas sp. CCNWLW162]|uniref:hypothetical protein n=1 Tax=Stenotrophomonas sp. CCNWLW162 TaxID=3127480 RepID=UPI0030789820
MKRALPPAQLRLVAAKALGEEVDEFDHRIASPSGQSIEVVTPEGQWPTTLFIELIGTGTKKVPWAGQIHSNPLLEWIVRSWLIDRLQTVLHVRPIQLLLRRISDVQVSAIDAVSIERALSAWIEDMATACVAENRDDVPMAGVLLYQWALEVQAVPGFSDWTLYRLQALAWRGRGKSYGQLTTLRDPVGGPYTRPELARIETAISSSAAVSTRQRAAFYLCRDWGPRPVQLALMRASDFGEDSFGPYVDIPSVKAQRAKLRRADGNIVRRHITDQAAEAVHRQMLEAESQVSMLREKMQGCLSELGIERCPAPLPLFPRRERPEPALMRFCEDSALYPYTLHATGGMIGREIADIGKALALVQDEAIANLTGDSFATILAYRLRRTKGTAMVLMGCSREEVAEALDHATPWSVEHYFRYSTETHDLISAAAASSQQIAQAANMWEGRFLQDAVPETGERPVGGLGRCTLKTPCPKHPRISCYACHRFRPDRNADHSAALKEIVAYDELMRQQSTGPVRNQLSLEVLGAMSLVQHLCRDDGGGNEGPE